MVTIIDVTNEELIFFFVAGVDSSFGTKVCRFACRDTICLTISRQSYILFKIMFKTIPVKKHRVFCLAFCIVLVIQFGGQGAYAAWCANTGMACPMNGQSATHGKYDHKMTTPEPTMIPEGCCCRGAGNFCYHMDKTDGTPEKAFSVPQRLYASNPLRLVKQEHHPDAGYGAVNASKRIVDSSGPIYLKILILII